MTARTLRLRKETLAELTPGELRAVAGASGDTGCLPTADGLACTYATLTFCPDYYCTGTV